LFEIGGDFLTIKRPTAKSQKEPGCHIEIPATIPCDINAVGGVKDLCGRLPKLKNITEMSAIHNALSDPVRLTILYLLAIQPLCVCIIKDCIGIADSKLSSHLTGLKKADLIEGEQHGNWIIYRLTSRGQKFAYESA
jgi:ArsR family transcriptional regulator